MIWLEMLDEKPDSHISGNEDNFTPEDWLT